MVCTAQGVQHVHSVLVRSVQHVQHVHSVPVRNVHRVHRVRNACSTASGGSTLVDNSVSAAFGTCHVQADGVVWCGAVAISS